MWSCKAGAWGPLPPPLHSFIHQIFIRHHWSRWCRTRWIKSLITAFRIGSLLEEWDQSPEFHKWSVLREDKYNPSFNGSSQNSILSKYSTMVLYSYIHLCIQWIAIYWQCSLYGAPEAGRRTEAFKELAVQARKLPSSGTMTVLSGRNTGFGKHRAGTPT